MKRKLFVLSLAFVLCFSVSSVNAASVSLLPDVQDAFPGDFVSIDLVLADFAVPVLGATLDITFDSTVLSFADFTWDAAFFDPAELVPPPFGTDNLGTMSQPFYTSAPTLSPGLLSGLSFGNDGTGITSATVGTLLFQVDLAAAFPQTTLLGLTASADSWISALDFTTIVSTDLNPASINVVPIPGALLLLGSGLIGLVGLRRKLS